MLIMFQNSIAYNDLDPEDLERVENPVLSHLEGRCWFEVVDGDESLQRGLGDCFTWEDLLEGDYSSGNDLIIAPAEIREDISGPLARLGFSRQKGYFNDDDRYQRDAEPH